MNIMQSLYLFSECPANFWYSVMQVNELVLSVMQVTEF